MEGDKENRISNLRLGGYKMSKALLRQTKKDKLEQPNSLPAVQISEMKPNQLGFWSKKLQDLEKSVKKKRKSELYEFSCTDESEVSKNLKMKRKQKGRILKKKGVTEPKFRKPTKRIDGSLKPEQKTIKQALFKKEVIHDTEQKELIQENKNSAFSPDFQMIAFTSTPTVKNDNFIAPSNSLLLSPIIKEGYESFNVTKAQSSFKLNGRKSSPNVIHFDQETPKAEKAWTRLRRMSCRRVLRSGKMLTK